MKMLKSDQGGIGGVSCRRGNGLVEQGRSANGLDPHFNRAGFVAKNTGIKVDVVGLAGSGGEGLRKDPAGGSKSG